MHACSGPNIYQKSCIISYNMAHEEKSLQALRRQFWEKIDATTLSWLEICNVMVFVMTSFKVLPQALPNYLPCAKFSPAKFTASFIKRQQKRGNWKTRECEALQTVFVGPCIVLNHFWKQQQLWNMFFRHNMRSQNTWSINVLSRGNKMSV